MTSDTVNETPGGVQNHTVTPEAPAPAACAGFSDGAQVVTPEPEAPAAYTGHTLTQAVTVAAAPGPVGFPPGAQYPKSTGIAYLLMLFTFIGFAGIQHFYLGKIGRGLLWLLTWGLFGFGLLVDLFTLPSQTRTVNAWRRTGS